MSGALCQYFVDDHRRLDKCLMCVVAPLDELNTTAYTQLRAGYPYISNSSKLLRVLLDGEGNNSVILLWEG
jgi:hypothetical protein